MAGSLLMIAFLLGMLAFFEPCTIATHSLFIARTHQQASALVRNKLLVVWIARSLLLASILALVVIFLPVPDWSAATDSLILCGMAILYMLTRFIYLPVPHLEFHRLVPYHSNLPETVKLGLSLPACTLPFFIVTIGLISRQNDPIIALLTGLSFATGFTLPMILVTYTGLSSAVKDLFQKAAQASPWLTAILLLAGALYLFLPQVDLGSQALGLSLAHASWSGLGLSFLAGFIFSFNPVSFASIPMMLAYVTRAHAERRAVLMGGSFVLGMISTHVVLGVGAAIGGEGIKAVLGREWGLLLGPVLIVLGLVWAGWLKLRLPWFGLRARKVSGIGGAFLLAIPFSIAVCPFCTPALLVTLTASAAIGSAGFGFALLLAFALGRSIPILIGAWSMGWLESLSILSRYQRGFETVAGIVLILTGLYLLNETLLFIEM